MQLNRTNDFFGEIRLIISEARKKVSTYVNVTLVETYWQIGKKIIEEEQNGKERAEYGTYLIAELSKQLTKEFGKGFDKRNLFFMKQFYLKFPIVNAVRSQLSWTHYRLLISIENQQAREYYITETIANNWEHKSFGASN
jgi:predicted nuclease of restriction endonuclease-like (RecB) superfamily